MKLTAANLVSAIQKLPPNRTYDYPNPKNGGKIEVVAIGGPEGPVIIKRYDPSKGQTSGSAKPVSISSPALWRLANAISENQPVNIDRVFGASYNFRSALEALLLHTPEFYLCNPGRIELLNSSTKVKAGHKHLLWLPQEPHANGVISIKKTDVVISEVATQVVYEALQLPSTGAGPVVDIEIARRHAQMQIALVLIGKQLGFRTWVAQNDKGIVYKDQKIGEMQGIVPRLEDEQLLRAYTDAAKAALLIDCIWFRNGKFMPAVIEIEHSTGVISGLNRMKGFYDRIPPLQDIRWVIVAPDEDREKVVRAANEPQFKDLKAQFMPYSSVEELYSLCSRRKIKGVNDDFLDCFMEPCVQ